MPGVRYLSDQFRAQAQECFRLAAEARDRWVAKMLEDMGHQLHERPISLRTAMIVRNGRASGRRRDGFGSCRRDAGHRRRKRAAPKLADVFAVV